MADKIKLGLSRNRLFDFNSTVVFIGKLSEAVESELAQKAMKMLECKEPVITAKILLQENSQAYIVTEAVEQKLMYSELSAKDIAGQYKKNPLSFHEKLFEFSASADGCLIIAGHTAVCDCKSLLRLAGSFMAFYNKTELSVEPEKIFTFSGKGELPVDVISPLVNKLSSELDDDWQKDKKEFTLEDYEAAREKYLKTCRKPVAVMEKHLDSKSVEKLKSACEELEVDFSSMLYFCFYKAILENVKVSKKAAKMRIYADRRFFHGPNDVFSVGAYNGAVCVSLSAKERKKSVEEQLKAFHLDAYRALTSSFRVFSEEILLASVQQDFCDSSYMYLAGQSKAGSSKKLAETYGCLTEELCDCFYCNLTQKYYEKLRCFEDISVCEPFKARSRFNLSLIHTVGGVNITFEYIETELTNEQAKHIFSSFDNMLSAFEGE